MKTRNNYHLNKKMNYKMCYYHYYYYCCYLSSSSHSLVYHQLPCLLPIAAVPSAPSP